MCVLFDEWIVNTSSQYAHGHWTRAHDVRDACLRIFFSKRMFFFHCSIFSCLSCKMFKVISSRSKCFSTGYACVLTWKLIPIPPRLSALYGRAMVSSIVLLIIVSVGGTFVRLDRSRTHPGYLLCFVKI